MFKYKCKLFTAVTIEYISSCLKRDAYESTNNHMRIQVLLWMPISVVGNTEKDNLLLEIGRKRILRSMYSVPNGYCMLFFGKGESSGQINKIIHLSPPSYERDALGIVSLYLEPGEDNCKIIFEIKLNASKERDMLISY